MLTGVKKILSHMLGTDIRLLIVAWALLVILAFIASRHIDFIIIIENTVNDLYASIDPHYRAYDSDIILVTITENTLGQFAYRSPVDRQFLSEVLLTLDKANVRAVGIDILFDQKTEQYKDIALQNTINEVEFPTVVAWANPSDNLTNAQTNYLNSYTNDMIKGHVKLGKDKTDGLIRWIDGDMNVIGKEINSFPHILASVVGHEIDSEIQYLKYSFGPKAGSSPFKSYEAQFIRHIPPEWLSGKIVLIGADLPHNDRHNTPLDRFSRGGSSMMAGIEIHAHALSQLLSGMTFQRYNIYTDIIFIIILLALSIFISSIEMKFIYKFLGFMVLLCILWGISLLLERLSFPLQPVVCASLGLIIATGIGTYISGKRQRKYRQFVTNAFSQYMSPQLLKELKENPEKLRLGGERKEITLIFTDIAGFTSTSEVLNPEVLVENLNLYLEGMVEIILRYNGVIDKFIGDAIMATFNAPNDCPDHSTRAVMCALELDQYARKFRKNSLHKNIEWGLTRIGVHSNPAIVGNIGGAERFEYTSIGDMVNTTARLEGINKLFGTSICVSAMTANKCPGLNFRPIGELILKGKTEPIQVLTPEKEKSELSKLYIEAYTVLGTGDNQQASDMFKNILEIDKNDVLSRFHLDRLVSGESGVLIRALEK